MCIQWGSMRTAGFEPDKNRRNLTASWRRDLYFEKGHPTTKTMEPDRQEKYYKYNTTLQLLKININKKYIIFIILSH